jgi:hypothetical protein
VAGGWGAAALAGTQSRDHRDLDLAAVQEQRRMFDPVGHYSRPDVFTLHVDARAKSPVVFEGGAST